jgi:hypothetical protein
MAGFRRDVHHVRTTPQVTIASRSQKKNSAADVSSRQRHRRLAAPQTQFKYPQRPGETSAFPPVVHVDEGHG